MNSWGQKGRARNGELSMELQRSAGQWVGGGGAGGVCCLHFYCAHSC